MIYVELVFFAVLILLSAIVLTNALEHLGARMKISEGVTGSLFAAIGTALPETTIPILALFFASEEHAVSRSEVGVGAILGAPLLLSTLAMFLIAVAVVRRRRLAGKFEPEASGLCRDLDFFLPAYIIVALALFIPSSMRLLSILIAVLLVGWYLVYILRTVQASSSLVEAGYGTATDSPLLLSYFKLPANLAATVLQIVIGIALLVWGAEGLIHSIGTVSTLWGVRPLVLSLLIAPFASEMPEKVNSILWVRRRRDTLAFGNVTGAMVFQGTLLPALGIIMTPWRPEPAILASVTATLIAAAWLRLILTRGHLRIWHMAVNGALYVGYIVVVLPILGVTGG